MNLDVDLGEEKQRERNKKEYEKEKTLEEDKDQYKEIVKHHCRAKMNIKSPVVFFI